MQFVKSDININFIGKKKEAFILSLILIGVTLASLLIHKGPRYGIDFAGGTLIQVKFSSAVDLDIIQSGLKTVGLEKSSVQLFGDPADNEYLIRTERSEEKSEGLSSKVSAALAEASGETVEIGRFEMVGPQVGKDLREKALKAMFFALLFITIYISGRFESEWIKSGIMAGLLISAVVFAHNIFTYINWDVGIGYLIAVALIVTIVLFWVLQLKYAMGAIVALVHDVTITIGVFSILNLEFTLPIIAALLTIIGYSLNDTIIVFDRIRENLKKYRKESLAVIINKSINETISRTILTSLTTLMVVVTLFFLGGGIIHNFAFAMIIGVLIGTYSSIFVASPILLAWQERGRSRI